MFAKILIISLTLIALSTEENLRVEYLDADNSDKIAEVSNATDFVVCVHMNENLKKEDTFFLVISTDEKGVKMDRKIHYYFVTHSCKDSKEMTVNLANINDPFYLNSEGKYDTSNSDSLYNEYEIKKLNDNENYMIAAITGGNGKKIKVAYAKMSPTTLLIILGCSIAGGVVLIIVVLIIICCCFCRRKKVAAVQQQYQSSFVNEPIIPQ